MVVSVSWIVVNQRDLLVRFTQGMDSNGSLITINNGINGMNVMFINSYFAGIINWMVKGIIMG